MGGSIGAMLPPEMLARLNAKAGGSVLASETPDGFLLIGYDEVEEQVRIAREFMSENGDIFCAFAKC
jgi:hypothetical protein